MGEDPREIREEIEATRTRMGDTVEAIGYKADVKTRAKESVQEKVGGIRDRITGATGTVSEATPGTEDVKRGARRAAGVAQRNPIGLAFGSFAGGFLLGMAIPSTRVEDEKLGPVATEVKERAKETAQEAVDRGKDVAQQAAQSAAETAREEGRTQAEELKETAQQQAQQTRESATNR